MLPGALLLSVAIRATLLVKPRSYQADEVFQYLEQAHRLVFGPGVIPWEYRLGIRSWLFPLALSGPMALGGWLAPGTGAYLLLPKIALVLLSLTVVRAAYSLGRRISPLHALVAALVAAGWSELALFATQALSDSVALPLFFGGAALLYGKPGPRRLAAAGSLLALACLIRFQDTPAILLFVVLVCRLDRQRWLWGLAGAVPMLAISAAIDLAMGQAPFGWVWANFHQNITVGRSYLWVEKPSFYLRRIVTIWKVAALPILILAGIGARRYPALLAMAAADIALHSAVAHKEYRYILLATTAIALLAAIGTADAVTWARQRWSRAPWLTVALLFWGITSIMTTRPRFVAYEWSQATPSLEAFTLARNSPEICGLAVHGIWWSHTGAYAYLHRPIPQYLPDFAHDPGAALRTGAPAFDAIVAPPRTRDLPSSYGVKQCFGEDGRYPDQAACLYERSGVCDPRPAAPFEINRALIATDR
ncbi:hypothetical protein HZF05_16745 [Sphingomonas sp. CGMCC 1.13654]|uniref:Mannosyltransferase n=1 Tax=Sphingomonas chungangi TaxID=2683589 RepID=A0A838L968_9SPHN|nr:hypothetical protein [Sphingomonas chungangi]MBA2935734.1 hypothetical protein [Sphingomonas chungangi]